ncbi:MAG: site-specific integrase [Candidatus Gastranaerophilales bacterium]|nr:site-specific integrase [Candidatus Gastranaerophilales bacterium]
MAGISKKTRTNKNGTKKVFYTITYRDIYGKQHTSRCYRTKSEAQAHLSEFNNVNPSVANITFEQVFKPYIDLALPKYSHTTQATYKLYIEKVFAKLYPLKYDKVSSMDLQKFIDDIEQTHTPFVAQLCLKIARAVCNYAIKHNLIKENKFKAVDTVIVNPKSSEHLTEEQERMLLKACKKLYPKYYALFYTLMGTGMRIGEALALEVTDINFNNKSIKVNKQFTKGKYKDGAKNRARIVTAEERDVYLADDVLDVLKEHIKSLSNDTKILFPSQVNKYLNVENLRSRVWKPLLVYADITDRVRIHDLRGSYADIALDHGASIKFIQNQLGHKKSQTTLDVYAKNNQDMIDKALGGMNDILRS